MKTIRVFTVYVTRCSNCHDRVQGGCDHPLEQMLSSERERLVRENSDAITTSCPRYAETKLIEVKD